MSLINDTLKEIEKIKASISDLEEKLAEELRQEILAVEQVNQWNDPVPSVREEEPMSDPIETKLDDAGIEFEDKTPPRRLWNVKKILVAKFERSATRLD